MLSITLTRTESYDPLYVIEQATRQAVAEAVAREHANPADPGAPTYRYEKDANSEGDYVDLVISGTDERRMGLVLKRLRGHGYELECEWASDEDPPHCIEIVSSNSGDGALPARAREAVEAMGYHHVPLLRDPTADGCYLTAIPESFPARREVTLGDSDWTVSVLYR